MKKIFFLFLLVTASLQAGQIVQIDEGTLLNGAAMEISLQVAQATGLPTSLDLFPTSPQTIEKYRERILANLEKFTKIVYLNEEQAFALTHLPPEQAAQFLKNFCPFVVLKDKNQGFWVYSEGAKEHFSDIPTIEEICQK